MFVRNRLEQLLRDLELLLVNKPVSQLENESRRLEYRRGSLSVWPIFAFIALAPIVPIGMTLANDGSIPWGMIIFLLIASSGLSIGAVRQFLKLFYGKYILTSVSLEIREWRSQPTVILFQDMLEFKLLALGGSKHSDTYLLRTKRGDYKLYSTIERFSEINEFLSKIIDRQCCVDASIDRQ
jgi:hypothetical protein